MTKPTANKTKPYFPLAGLATDGFSNDEYASATCYCGAVQLRLVRLSLCSLDLGADVAF